MNQLREAVTENLKIWRDKLYPSVIPAETDPQEIVDSNREYAKKDIASKASYYQDKISRENLETVAIWTVAIVGTIIIVYWLISAYYPGDGPTINVSDTSKSSR